MSNEKLIFEEESYFSFSQVKIGLMSSKKNVASPLTPSPKKIFDEDTNFPEIDFTPSQSSCPTAATFSMSSKLSNILISNELSKPSSSKIKPIEIHKKKAAGIDDKINLKPNSKSAKIFFDDQFKTTQEINNLIHSQKKVNFREDIEKSSSFINEFSLDAKITDAEVQGLSNTQDIRDFHEYTKECIQDMKKVVIKDYSPRKVYLDPKILHSIKTGTKKLAVFDLDETLVHREVENIEKCDKIIEITMPNKAIVKIGINIRPLLEQSLKEISKNYHLVLFTASQQIYAEKVLEIIDPNKKYFIMSLYRDSCKIGQIDKETIFIKDLDIFQNVPLEKIIIIDNSVLSFCRQLYNGIPILPYYDNKQDTELKDLVYYLEFLTKCDDIRIENKNIFRLNSYKDSSDFNSSSSDEFVLKDNDKGTELDMSDSSNESIIEQRKSCLAFNTNSSLSEFSDYKTNEKSEDRHQELLNYIEIYKQKRQIMKMKENNKKV